MTAKSTKFVIFTVFFYLSAVDSLCAQQFSLVNQQSGLLFAHQNNSPQAKEPGDIAAGGAIGDYDFDGFPDLYLLGGDDQSNALFRNNGDGTFSNVAQQAGVDLFDILGSGPVFADVDGDSHLDLIVFSVQAEAQPIGSDPDLIENRPRLFINQGNGSFTDMTQTAGFYSGMPSYSGVFGDLDKDGDLDLFMSHWSAYGYTTSKQLFWLNDGTGQFSDATIQLLGLPQNANTERWTFTPYITDINQDDWPDVLLTSDFGTSRIFYSNAMTGGTLMFNQLQPTFITDENGMGSAVADYDNDGDLDWLVTSIWDPNGIAEGNWGVTGNRLYRNLGNGTFEDATDDAEIREGYWGWGACFADFNNDGHLDIYHENGWPDATIAVEFNQDPARLYMSDGDGTFTEMSVTAGLQYTGQGRGVSCFDYDLDGDLDILILPNNDDYQLYQNNTTNSNNYLQINLFNQGPNPFAIGAKIKLLSNSFTQLREISSGNNFVSNNPLQQHFGLGTDNTINQIEITWPDGDVHTIINQIGINQILSIGRFCHTKYFNYIDYFSSQTSISVFLHDELGNPLTSENVTLLVEHGPNQGFISQSISNATGEASFTLSANSGQTDRLVFSFQVNNESYLCKSLVDWNVDLIFTDGFE